MMIDPVRVRNAVVLCEQSANPRTQAPIIRRFDDYRALGY